MPNKNIFCNVPWTNTHVYWDGSFGACCSERHAPYPPTEQHSLTHTTVDQWYNSKPMVNFRERILGSKQLSECAGCYREEEHGYESRRIKENFKSVIFTEQAFDRSFDQSPMLSAFETTATDKLPIDWHVDLGNECNLACKMCIPQASSRIADFHRRWNLPTVTNTNWTQNTQAWENFKTSITAVPKLNRIHFMGGEPLLNRRFPEILDFLLEHQPDTSVSFVTNGTVYNEEILDRLMKFRSCDIEVSLESIHPNNHYIRQGSDTHTVLDNIKKLQESQTDAFHVVLRSVPQLLSVNNYNEYIAWAWEQKLPVQGIPLQQPAYLQIQVLPLDLRKSMVARYEQVRDCIQTNSTMLQTVATGRNIGVLDIMLVRECSSIICMLLEPEPENVAELRSELALSLQRWDQEFGLNAYVFYPEYEDFFRSIGYAAIF